MLTFDHMPVLLCPAGSKLAPAHLMLQVSHVLAMGSGPSASSVSAQGGKNSSRRVLGSSSSGSIAAAARLAVQQSSRRRRGAALGSSSSRLAAAASASPPAQAHWPSPLSFRQHNAAYRCAGLSAPIHAWCELSSTLTLLGLCRASRCHATTASCGSP